jgi:hypothetical protein
LEKFAILGKIPSSCGVNYNGTWLTIQTVFAIAADPGNATIKARVICHCCSDADENAIMAGAKIVSHGFGLRAGQHSSCTGR